MLDTSKDYTLLDHEVTVRRHVGTGRIECECICCPVSHRLTVMGHESYLSMMMTPITRKKTTKKKTFKRSGTTRKSSAKTDKSIEAAIRAAQRDGCQI